MGNLQDILITHLETFVEPLEFKFFAIEIILSFLPPVLLVIKNLYNNDRPLLTGEDLLITGFIVSINTFIEISPFKMQDYVRIRPSERTITWQHYLSWLLWGITLLVLAFLIGLFRDDTPALLTSIIAIIVFLPLGGVLRYHYSWCYAHEDRQFLRQMENLPR